MALSWDLNILGQYLTSDCCALASWASCIPLFFSLFTEWTEGPTSVDNSITEEEVEHISHMNRDAALAVHSLFTLLMTDTK